MIANLVQLKLYLGITGNDDDTLLTIFLNGANSFIETYISRTIKATDHSEIKDGNAQLFLILDNLPVNELTSVNFNSGSIEFPVWEVQSPNSYSLNKNTGQINFLVPLSRGFQNIKIAYNAGYKTIPADLVLVSLKIASKSYNTRLSDGITGESVAGDRIDFDVSQIPNDALVILSNYRDL